MRKIDTDYDPQQRYIIQQYLFNHPKLNSCHIVTYNTLQLKGAIREVVRGMDKYDSFLADEICSGLDDGKEGYYREKYDDIFFYVDRLIGVIVSVGQHACGLIVAEQDLESEMGTMTVVDSKTKEISVVTQINMKEIDAQNYVKLDLLSLDTVGVISETVNLVDELNWEDVSPSHIDYNDKAVIDSIKENNVGIFQFESDYAHEIYKKLFSDSTIAKIKSYDETVDYMDLLSLANGLIRPSANSFRDDVVEGKFYDNGHEALNKFLASSLGRLVYQEQIIQFLQQFCGYSGGEADVIRRAIGKKQADVINKLLPEIEDNFVKTMVNEYDTAEEEAREIVKPFLQTILDASDYGFSVNHSDAYSYLSFVTAWLRYYYPLEFLTASLNRQEGNADKTKALLDYAESIGIQIKDIEFGHSKTGYAFDKATNSIYRGIKAIKFLNADVGEVTWKYKDYDFKDFVDVLVALTERVELNELQSIFKLAESDSSKNAKAKCKELYANATKQVNINSRHVEILISLGFFKRFGGTGYLMDVYNVFKDKYKATLVIHSKVSRLAEIREDIKDFDTSKELTLIERCKAELEYTTKITTVDENVDKNIMMCKSLKLNKNNVRGEFYQFNSGRTHDIKIDMSLYRNNKFKEGDVVSFLEYKFKNKKRKIDGRWHTLNEKEIWAVGLRTVKVN